MIPNYNGEKFIVKTLRSVQQQTYGNFEVLVVDDASTDNSVSVVQEVSAADDRVRIIRLERNSGAAVCRNAAIRESKGRYLAFLDGDDLWAPEKLESQLAAMTAAAAPMSCTAVNVINEVGEVIGERQVPSWVSYATLLRRTPIVTSTVMIDTEKAGRLEMPLVVRRQDLAMWLKVIRVSGPVLGVNEVLGSYRVHSGSLSRNKWISAYYTWHVIRHIEGLPLIKALYYFSFYALGGIWGRLKGLN